MIVLHALGQCLIRTAMATVTPRADMCFALGAYLTRERGNRVPRRLIESLFWPDAHAGVASHCLSELIHKLRRRGFPIQRDGAACIWLPREAVSVDIDNLSSEQPASIASRDLTILPGYSPSASPSFSDWVDDWRGQLQLRVLDEVVTAAERAILAEDWSIALALANQALNLDQKTSLCAGNNGITCTGGLWLNGWQVVTQPAGSTAVLLTTHKLQPSNVSPKITTASGTTFFTFDGKGLATNITGAPALLLICDARGSAYSRAVEINLAGYIQSSTTPGHAPDNTPLVCP